MSKPIRWVGQTPEGLKAYSFKKDAPKGANLTRLNFGLFGYAWVERDQATGDLISTRGNIPVYDFYLFTPGHVIGRRDLLAAQHTAWSEEWREAMVGKIDERLALGVPR